MLADNKHSWVVLPPRSQAFHEVPSHRLAVVGDQDSILLSREFEEGRVASSPQTSGFDVEDIDGRLARTQALDDGVGKTFIREKADGHVRLASISCRAFSSRACRAAI